MAAPIRYFLLLLLVPSLCWAQGVNFPPLPDATATTRGLVPAPPNDATKVFLGNATFGPPPGAGGSVTIVSKITNYSVLAGDTGTYFDNNGAGGEVDFTLPSYGRGLRYCFTVSATQVFKILAPASTKISVGTTNSAIAGYVTSALPFSTLCVYATSVTNQWASDQQIGAWTVN